MRRIGRPQALHAILRCHQAHVQGQLAQGTAQRILFGGHVQRIAGTPGAFPRSISPALMVGFSSAFSSAASAHGYLSLECGHYRFILPENGSWRQRLILLRNSLQNEYDNRNQCQEEPCDGEEEAKRGSAETALSTRYAQASRSQGDGTFHEGTSSWNPRGTRSEHTAG